MSRRRAPRFEQTCFDNHMTEYCIRPTFMQQALALVKSGYVGPIVPDPSRDKDPWTGDKIGVFMDGSNAIVPIMGAMTRQESKFGGCNTTRTIRILEALGEDESVSRVGLYIDSPGGTYAGTPQLGNAVKALAAKKEVFAHVENSGLQVKLPESRCRTRVLVAQSA